MRSCALCGRNKNGVLLLFSCRLSSAKRATQRRSERYVARTIRPFSRFCLHFFRFVFGTQKRSASSICVVRLHFADCTAEFPPLQRTTAEHEIAISATPTGCSYGVQPHTIGKFMFHAIVYGIAQRNRNKSKSIIRVDVESTTLASLPKAIASR